MAKVLTDAGMDVRLCLPFEVDKSYDLPKDLHFSRLDRELPTASAVVCFGGDGTILHMAKTATRAVMMAMRKPRRVYVISLWAWVRLLSMASRCCASRLSIRKIYCRLRCRHSPCAIRSR